MFKFSRTSRIVFCAVLTLQTFSFSSLADEGMWLISLISKNMEDMKKLGLKLSAEEIYSINNSSLKDAVVLLDDGGCSAELISPYGLVLTNHHCAVGDIQFHSTTHNNLLKEGFWAENYKDELPIPGKTALILKNVEDITSRVEAMISQDTKKIREEADSIMEMLSKQASKGKKGIYVQVVPMFSYNSFYMFTYYRFTDVRLVGAPPSSIGNFGGDIDNWRWPRHTGDFTLLRIYSSPDGMPSDYSKRNVPYRPKHHFPISLRGVNENDFAMVIGYPGTTYRHSSSYHAEIERDVVAPWVDEVWGRFIMDIKETMEQDEGARVHFTDTHDMLVNFWQKDTYQAQSMSRFNVVERLKAREDSLRSWVRLNPSERLRYIEAMDPIESYFSYLKDGRYIPLDRSLSALLYWPVGVGGKIYENSELISAIFNNKKLNRKVRNEAKKKKNQADELFKDYYHELEIKLYSAALESLTKHLPDTISEPLLVQLKEVNYPELIIPVLVNNFFGDSHFASLEKYQNLLARPSIDSLANDPLFFLHLIFETLQTNLEKNIEYRKKEYREAERIFTKGLLEMEADKLHYPDANSTMRLSYGKVIGYQPRDGINFKPFTTLNGIIEKDSQEIDVFRVPAGLKRIFENRDFGMYADETGVMRVCFLTDNDITNGNSGSPVLNAEGQLVGVAFDGNYEAMACDFIFEPKMQRTIVTDIRYVLLIIDKFAGAKHLIDEMTILQ